MTTPLPWRASQRIAFRFVFAYLVLYNLPFPFGMHLIPLPPYERMWHAIVPWVGAHLLHLGTPITTFQNGSGDTTYNYVQLLCFLVIALVATLLWSIADRRRREYSMLYHYLRIYIRYSLGFTLVAYGMFKIIKAQFPFPAFGTLLETYGDSSPARLLWTMMGYSFPYNLYAGLLEAGAGMLLFWRRTTTLGALLGAAAMSNVLMLNLSYDVPVKLFAMHLLLMAVFLAVPDWRRLVDVFFTSGHDGRAPVLKLVIKALVLVVGIGTPTALAAINWMQNGPLRARPPLYGLYDVTQFSRNGLLLLPLVTDSTRWRYFIVEYPGSIQIRSTSGSERSFGARVDTVHHVIALRSRADAAHADTLRYATLATGALQLTGALGTDSLDVTLSRHDPRRFLLVSRGFHWINESPFMP